MMTKLLHWVSLEVRNFPYNDGLTNVEKFLDEFEREVPKKNHFQSLDLTLCAMPAQWWGTHKDNFEEWREYRIMIRFWFGHPKFRLTEKYDGINDLHRHLEKWTKVYGIEPQSDWVHILYHTLDIILMNWYLEIELRHGTVEWDILREGFFMTFSFEYGFESLDEALQEVNTIIFRIPLDPLELIQPDWSTQLCNALECYNVTTK